MELRRRFRSNGHDYSYTAVVASQNMMGIYDMVDKVAKSNVSVLLLGDTGVGKEIVAKELHHRSGRQGHFTPVNSVGIPEDLLESLLFGKVKGAYTSAYSSSVGVFSYANNGTIFVDEIGEVGTRVQGKLLRVLQDNIVIPLGAESGKKVDVRVIAATNRNLPQDVGNQRFRQDLWYRISAVTIYIPPLRERREEIPELLEYFTERFSREEKKGLLFSPEAVRLLIDYDWPGNIRELENFVRSTVLLHGLPVKEDAFPNPDRPTKNVVSPDDLDSLLLRLPHSKPQQPPQGSAQDLACLCNGTLEEIEKLAIELRLKSWNGNKMETARSLGLRRPLLYNKLKKYKID